MKSCEITGYIKRIEQLSGSLSGIPEGHWCVLSESSHLLIHVQSVLKMPVGETDLLDGSVGRRWSEYRKKSLGLPIHREIASTNSQMDAPANLKLITLMNWENIVNGNRLSISRQSCRIT